MFAGLDIAVRMESERVCFAKLSRLLTTLLARDAFVRVTRYCHDVRPSVHLSVRLSVCLGRACTV